MRRAGVETITDCVKKIDLVMRDDKFSIAQLEGIEKVFKAAHERTVRAVEKASKSQNQSG